MLGLIPKVKNTITLTITDTDGNATTRTIEQTGPKLLGEEEVRLEQAIAPDESTVTTLGNGLYAILGNDSNEQDFERCDSRRNPGALLPLAPSAVRQ